MNTRIYSIIVTCLAVLAIFAAGYFYWQSAAARDELDQVKNDLRQNQEQLSRLRELINISLGKAKTAAELLKDSGDTFLVAGDLKVAAISNTEAEAINAKIVEIEDKQDKIALESAWSDFLSSRKISDYFAFSRFLAVMIKNNLDNIR